MANLTVTIDEGVLGRARKRAIDGHTSVNAVVVAFLERYAGASPAADALATFFEIADSVGAGSGTKGRTWTRDELYDRTQLR
jgi:hypothetical protein